MNDAEFRTKYYGHWSDAHSALRAVTDERDKLLLQVEALQNDMEVLETSNESLQRAIQDKDCQLLIQTTESNRLIEVLRNGIVEAAGFLQNQSRQECHRRLMLLLGEIEVKAPEKRNDEKPDKRQWKTPYDTSDTRECNGPH